MYGSEPILSNAPSCEFIRWTNDAIYDEFYAKTESDVVYRFRLSVWYKTAVTSQYGTSSSNLVNNIDTLKYPCAEEIIPTETDPNSSQITSDISTNSLDPNRTSGLIVKDDNKLYYYTSETAYTCVSDRSGTVDMFGKQFRVIRNTEYKNK